MHEIIIDRYGGYGYGMFASTPITPPVEFAWVFLFFVIAYTAWDLYVLKDKVKSAIIIWRNIEYLLFFAFIFLLTGSFDFKSGWLPIPLGNAYYDLGWEDAWALFFGWNLWGLILFVFCKNRFCNIVKITGKDTARVIIGNIAIFLITLIPFISFEPGLNLLIEKR